MRHAALVLGAAVGLALNACSHKPAATPGGADASVVLPPPSAPEPSPGTPPQAAGADAASAHVSFAPARVQSAPARPRVAARTAQAGESVRIPAGVFHLGSTPGDVGRDPAMEADGLSVEVPAFDIDALPFPNDPSQPARTGVTRDEAANLCRSNGRRLCTEVEWERACRGPAENSFPGGDAWDSAACGGRGDPGACPSGFGALVMGGRAAEWTADTVDDRGIIRGGAGNADARLHRCAERRTAVSNQPGLEVAFRCCGGPAPSLPYPHEPQRPGFTEEHISQAQLSQIMATIPELARVREGLQLFSPGAIAEVLNHGATTLDQHPEVIFTINAVRWSPAYGEELLVFTAMSAAGSFVAALWVLPPTDGHTPRYRHAASFILAGDRVAMTLAYGRAQREEVQWSACWNCGGEHGVVTYDRESAHVLAVQR